MPVATTWVNENVGVYFRNATAVRDYRVQLRGSRAVILWAIYLLVLITFGMLTYAQAASRQQMSVVEAQQSLQNFYEQIMYLLGTMVLLIAPALTATAIVSERQRKSLDLVFSSPVSPKYYLVGKMISSYRYIWMLLVLSLPVTAACVVLGGASWSEVLASYGLLSLHGLIVTAIALLFSTLAQKPVGAIVWSYLGVTGYGILGSMIAAMGMNIPFIGSTRNINEVPFTICLSPYFVVHAASTYTEILGTRVPNWAIMAVFTVLIVKLVLAGAGSAISSFGSRETKSLRVHGIVYSYLLSLGMAATMGAPFSLVGSAVTPGSPSGVTNFDQMFGRLFISLVLPVFLFLPFISCFGTDLEKKYWPDGVFSLRRMLTGAPSGGLAYSLTLVLAIAGGVITYSYWLPGLLTPAFLAYVFFALCLVFASWTFGRFTSAMNNGLRYARTLQFTFFVLLMGLPLPFLSIADPFGFGGTQTSIWDVYVLRPLVSSGDRSGMALAFGTILLAVGFIILKVSEVLAKAKYSKVGLTYGSA